MDKIGIQISTTYNLNKQQLQNSLDKLSKTSNFNIKLNTDNSGFKNYETALNSLMHRYKMLKMTSDDFVKSFDKIKGFKGGEYFNALDWKKQEQFIGLMAKADKERTGTQNQTIAINNKILQQKNKEIENEQKTNKELEAQLEKHQRILATQIQMFKYNYKGLFKSDDIADLKSFSDNIKIDKNTIKNIDEANLRWKEMQANVRTLPKAIDETNKASTSLFSALSRNMMKYVEWMSVISVFMAIKNSVTDAIQTVTALDTSMISLRKVTSETEETYKSFLESSNKVARSLAVQTTQAIDATTAWVKAGNSLADAQKLSSATLIGSNVGDVSVDQMQKFLIAPLKAYNIEARSAIDIVSKMNNISNLHAITIEDLGQAYSRASSVMAMANNDINQFTALITAAQAQTQLGGDNIGNGLRTIALRLSSMKDEEGQVIPRLAEDFKAVGITLRDVNGEMKSTYDIISQMSEAFKSGNVSQSKQLQLLELAAGKMRSNILAATIENFEEAQIALNDSINAGNSALDEQAKYMQSIQAHAKILRESIVGLWNGFISSETIKNVLTLATRTIDLISNIGALNSVILVTAGILGAKGAFGFALRGITASFAQYIWGATASTAATVALSSALSVLVPIAAIGAVIGLSKGIDALITTQAEWKEKIADTTSEINTLTGEISSLSSELDALNSKEFLTQDQEKQIKYLEKKITLMEIEKGLEQDKLDIQQQSLGESILKNFDSLNYQSEDPSYLQTTLDYYKAQKIAVEDVSDSLEEQMLKEGTLNKLQQDMLKEYKDLTIALENMPYDSVSMEIRKYYAEIARTLGLQSDEFSYYTDKVDNFKKLNTVIDEQAKSQEELNKIQESTTKSIDEYKSSLSSLESIQKSINEGDKLSLSTMLELLQKYPALSSLIQNANSSKQAGLELTKAIFETEKNTFNEKIRMQKIELENTYKLIEADINALKTKIGIVTAMGEMNAVFGGNDQEYSNLAALSVKLYGIQSQMESLQTAGKLINDQTFGDFKTSTINKDKKEKDPKTLEPYYDKLKEINALKAEESALESKQSIDGKNYSDKILSNLTEQQDKLHSLNDLKKSDLALLEKKLSKDKNNVELIKQVGDQQDSILSTSQEWMDIEVKKAGILDDQKELIKQQKDLADEVTKSYLDTVSSIEDSITSTSDSISSMKSELSDLNQQKTLAPFIAQLESISQAEEQATESLTQFKNAQESAISSINNSYESSIDSLTNKIEEYQSKVSDISLEESFADESLTQFKHAQELALDSINDKHSEAIDLLTAEIELEKSKSDAIDQEIERQNKLIAIEEAKIKLTNAQNERTIKNLNTDGTFSFIADPEAIKSAQDELTQANESYADYQRDYNLKLKEDKLKLLQDERDAELKVVQDIIDARQDEYDAKKYEWDREKFLINEEIRVNNDTLSMLTEQRDARIKIIQDIIDARQAEYDTKQFNWDREKFRINEEISAIESRYALEEDSIQSLIDKKQADIDFENTRLTTLTNIRDTDLANFNLWKDGQLLGYDELLSKKAMLEKINGVIGGISSASNANQLTTSSTPSTGFGTKSTDESKAYFNALKSQYGDDDTAITQAEITRTLGVIEARKGLDTSAQEDYLKRLQAGTVQFSQGGDITKDGLAYVHNKEGVIPSAIYPDIKKFLFQIPDFIKSIQIPQLNIPSFNATKQTQQAPLAFYGDITIQANNAEEVGSSIRRHRVVGVNA